MSLKDSFDFFPQERKSVQIIQNIKKKKASEIEFRPSCLLNFIVLKETVHPELKFHLFSTHRCVGAGSGDIF